MLRILGGGALAVVLSVSVGCTRKTETTAINMTMPDWSQITGSAAGKSQGKSGVGAMAVVKVVGRVMINVTGPGIATPVVYIWELNRKSVSGNSIPTPPKEFELTVPRGSQRLIQVLVLVEDYDTASMDTDGAMAFYYGDQTKSLSSAVETVHIELASITTSKTEGSISGRFFNADGSTPSGAVNMYFAPPGKSPMIVDRSAMFSGYFHFFLLPGVPFTYRLENGTTLFDSITTSNFNSGLGTRAVHIAVPEGYRDHGSGDRSYRTDRRKIVGFFGPGSATGKTICYPPSSEIGGFYTAATGGSLINWNPAAPPTLVSVARVINGGAPGTCPGNFGLDLFVIELQNLLSGEAPLPMRGPFREISVGDQRTYLSVTPTSETQLSVDWDYLPGVVGNSIDGVGLFYRVYNPGENIDDDWHDTAPCNSLASEGFTEITRVSAVAGNPVSAYAWNSAPVAAFVDGRLKTLACPYSNSKSGYYDFAVSHNSHWNSGPLPAARIEVSSITEPGVVTSNLARQKVGDGTCTAVHIRTLDVLGRRAVREGGWTYLAITSSDGGLQFFDGPECATTVATGTMNIQFNGDEYWLNVKPTSGSASQFQLSITDTIGGTGALPSVAHYMEKTVAQVSTHLRTTVPDLSAGSKLRAWGCYPINYVSGVPEGSRFISNFFVGLSVVHATATGLSYYLDSGCSVIDLGPVDVDPSGTYTSFARRYFMYTGNDSNVSVAPSSASGLSVVPLSVAVEHPAAPTKLWIPQIGMEYYSACLPVQLLAINDLWQPSPVSAPQVITPEFSPAPQTGDGFFSDSSCTPGNEVAQLGLMGGEARGQNLYFRWNQIGSLTIAASAVAGTLPFQIIQTEVSP